jgi:hypothetical protein
LPGQPLLRKDLEVAPEPASFQPRAVLRAAQLADAATPSPAVAMQHELERQWRLRASASQSSRWSPRATLAVSTAIALALWGAVATALFALK